MPPLRRFVRLAVLPFALSGIHAARADVPAAAPVKVFAEPDRIRYDGHCLTIEGKDVFVYSAAFHYFRAPKELWRDRFRKIKEAGFNTVETYVPWNRHERSMSSGPEDFSKMDFTELEDWLKMAQDEFGFYTIVRPGPFICAEWSGGAYPRWLAKFRPESIRGFWLRGTDPEHIRWSKHWYDAVSKVIAREQIGRKAPGGKGVILVQLENEYDYHGADGKEKLLRALYESVRGAGVKVPLFTCLTGQCRGSADPELSQVFDSDNYYVGLTDAGSCALRMADLRRRQPDAPGFVTELQGGWFSTVGGGLPENTVADTSHFNAINLMTLLGGATGINDYMFVGGTHFDGWGARGMTTTYDYKAPVRESGAVGDKYAVAVAIGDFLRENAAKLVRADGGPCEMTGDTASLFGGVRTAPDGTRFVFLHNKDPKNPHAGTVTLLPAKSAKASGPVYNIDQNGNKVLMVTGTADDSGSAGEKPVTVAYELASLGARVLVIAPGDSPDKGVWWPKPVKAVSRPATLPAPVRVGEAFTISDSAGRPAWMKSGGLSLSEIGIDDFRYSPYRAGIRLDAADAKRMTRLLINSYSRDIITVSVNGKVAPRTFPDDRQADAQAWPTRDADKRIRADEYDNRFDVAGLLREGDNEIVAIYENLGHAHGYAPMEELAGIRSGGLGSDDLKVLAPLAWDVARDLAGIAAGWTNPGADTAAWTKVKLDTQRPLPHQGSEHPKGDHKELVTWWRAEFELPATDPSVWVPWFARVRASGNGYMWLNGHNIGRHWEAGRQRDFFLPECWLNYGPGAKNTLVLGLRGTASGALLEGLEIAPYPAAAETR